MNRILLMVLRNITKVPGLYSKLCRYAKNPDAYPEQERWDHICHIMKLAVQSGNLDLQVTGTENIPAPGTAFMMYPEDKTQCFRLNFSTPTDEAIVKGMKILGEVKKMFI